MNALLVRFLAFCRFTGGLIDVYPGFQKTVDGVGLVTLGALCTEGWLPPIAITSAWADVYAVPSTTWTDVYATPSTAWTEILP